MNVQSPVSKSLLEARALIEQETRWTRGETARDARGKPVSACDPKAVCFCAAGACSRVTKDMPLDAYFAAMRALERVVTDVPVYNDFNPNGHRGVMEMFDKAIEREEELWASEAR